MENYPFSELTIYHSDRESDDRVRCRVEISEDHCVLVYDQVDGTDKVRNVVKWSGEGANGHYILFGEVPSRTRDRCKATLHRFPDTKLLNGFWREHGFSGMWRITLS